MVKGIRGSRRAQSRLGAPPQHDGRGSEAEAARGRMLRAPRCRGPHGRSVEEGRLPWNEERHGSDLNGS